MFNTDTEADELTAYCTEEEDHTEEDRLEAIAERRREAREAADEIAWDCWADSF